MGNFSIDPLAQLLASVAKGYVGLHVEQGVPVLDRDLNLLGDLLAATIRQTLGRHVGDGVAGLTNDFAIVTNGNANDFSITAGTYLVGGLAITLAANTTYLTQKLFTSAIPPLTPLTTPTAAEPNPRIDLVYLDLWQDEVTDAPGQDPNLGNPGDVGIRTSTRVIPSFVVRVAQNSTSLLSPPVGHTFCALAQLSRATAAAVPGSGTPANNVIIDLRQTGLSIPSLLQRVQTIEKLLAPSITAYGPPEVVPGQISPIVIHGKNLLVGSPHVFLGNVEGVIDFGASSPTELVVHVPFNAAQGTWPLTVRNDVGTATGPFPIVVDAPPPLPVFAATGSQIGPTTHAPAGSSITLNGAHFLGINRVVFNAPTPLSAVPGAGLQTVSDSVITVNIPATLAAGLSVTVTVAIDGAPTYQATSVDKVTVDSAAPPPIPPSFGPIGSQISPTTQSIGNSVTLNGSNFGTSSTTTQVSFIGTNTVIAKATDFVSVAPNKIVVKVPVGLTVASAPNNQAQIKVTVNGLSATSNDLLSVA